MDNVVYLQASVFLLSTRTIKKHVVDLGVAERQSWKFHYQNTKNYHMQTYIKLDSTTTTYTWRLGCPPIYRS